MTIWLILTALWMIFFGFTRFASDSTCTEAKLMLFAAVAFWLLAFATIALSIYISWLW